MAIATAIGGGACNLEPSVPGTPSYELDVKPILEARCIRCHSYPSVNGYAPGDRFDLYDCSGMPDAGAVCTAGAKDHAAGMVARITLDKDNPLRMPLKPSALLSPYQIDTIVKWAAGNPPAP